MLTNGLTISLPYVVLIGKVGKSDHQGNKNILED